MNKIKLKLNINKKLFRLNKNGFAALFAILISSIIFAMTLGITNTSIKEAQLNIQAKEGHIALFAADSGIECALYGDLTSTILGFGDPDTPPQSTFDCVGADNNIGGLGTLDFTGSLSPYSFELSLSDNQCARVFVDKNYPEYNADGTEKPGVSDTKIDSYGYNVPCEELPNKDNTKKVERALRVTYPN